MHLHKLYSSNFFKMQIKEADHRLERHPVSLKLAAAIVRARATGALLLPPSAVSLHDIELAFACSRC